jgi:hypothetical protein
MRKRAIEPSISMGNYTFHVKTEKIFEVSFRIEDTYIESSCSCHADTGDKLCWHRHYVLAGRRKKLSPDERSAQQDFLARLSTLHEGRELIREGTDRLGEKEVCRRCNSPKVIDLKKSTTGKFIFIFLPKTRRYFCKACKWSW